MKITLIDMIAKGVEYPLSDDETIQIGRDLDNDIIIPDRKYRNSLDGPAKLEFDKIAKTISREHCIIYQNSGKEPYITDGMSTRGTTVNGLNLNEDMNANLKNGDILKLGDYELMARIE